MKRVVIYARVSTAIQDYDRQIDELKDYANRMNYQVVKVFCEKVSGAKKVAERNALSELLYYVEAHHIDKVLIYECSRLSRRIVDFLQVIERLTEKGISLYILQNGLETLQSDGKPACIGHDSAIQQHGKRTYPFTHGEWLQSFSCQWWQGGQKARLQEILRRYERGVCRRNPFA